MSSPPVVPKQAASSLEKKGAGQRLHERLAVQSQVHLSWQDREGARVLQARALDISRFGLLVEAEKAIAPGTLVSVQTKATLIGKACVRHCTPKGAKYRIGLRLPDRMTRGL